MDKDPKEQEKLYAYLIGTFQSSALIALGVMKNPMSNKIAQNLIDLLEDKRGITSEDDRKQFALSAFNVSSHYDSEIFKYFDGDNQSSLKLSESTSQVLRYGENPHQKGAFYGDLNQMFEKLHGKELSYNNLLDVDAAVNLIAEFKDTTFAVLKHNNACGVASRPTVLEAWKDALAGDPVSAFGGVLITNTKLDKSTAEEIQKLFFEVLIAPAYDEDALPVLKSKKNRIILIQKEIALPNKSVRTALNGTLVQDVFQKWGALRFLCNVLFHAEL